MRLSVPVLVRQAVPVRALAKQAVREPPCTLLSMVTGESAREAAGAGGVAAGGCVASGSGVVAGGGAGVVAGVTGTAGAGPGTYPAFTRSNACLKSSELTAMPSFWRPQG